MNSSLLRQNRPQAPVMAFITPFPLAKVCNDSGSALFPRRRMIPPFSLPCMSMRGDGVAPVISVVDTKMDQSSRVGLSMQRIIYNEAMAASLLEKAALGATLARKGGAGAFSGPPSPKASVGTDGEDVRAIVEKYFPNSYRGTAPVITVSSDGVGVRWEKIEKVVAGVSSGDAGGMVSQKVSSVGATKSEPFWKQGELKWAKMAQTTMGASQDTSEVIETAKFEKHFPTRVRNRAPMIRLQGPKDGNYKLAFLEVGNEFVTLNESLARQLNIPERSKDDPNISAAATVQKYFAKSRLNLAPIVEIDGRTPSVVMEMKEIGSSPDLASSVARKFQ